MVVAVIAVRVVKMAGDPIVHMVGAGVARADRLHLLGPLWDRVCEPLSPERDLVLS